MPYGDKVAIQQSPLDPVNLRQLDTIYDDATAYYLEGQYRQAFIGFDICVSARRFNAQYRLSRGICAFMLNIFLLTFEDAHMAFQMGKDEVRDPYASKLQNSLSQKLQESLQLANRRHLARCRYWMGKAQFELGDIPHAHGAFVDSRTLLASKKAQDMLDDCEAITKEGRVHVFRQTAASRCQALFYDDDGEAGFHLRFFEALPDRYDMLSLRHPKDDRLPLTITGSHGVFERRAFYAERAKWIRQAFEEQDSLCTVDVSSGLA